ncbi:MAG TPA: SDR family NAD(P)-dependent oxidoreductase [Pyrinomonadaceae bacterium]
MDVLNQLKCTVQVKGTDPIVRDHSVYGVNIMPGVSFIDIIYRILRSKNIDTANLELRKILFLHPVVANAQFDSELRFEFTSHGSFHKLSVSARKLYRDGSRAGWQQTLECELHFDSKFPDISLNLGALLDGAENFVDMDEVYALTRSTGIIHGEFMKGLGTIHVAEGGILAEIHLSESARQYLDYFYIHPTYLDASTILPNHFAGHFVSQFGEVNPDDIRAYIPMYIESFRARQQTGEKCLVYVKPPRYKGTLADLNVCDLEFYDREGLCVMWVRGLTSKRVRSDSLITQWLDTGLTEKSGTSNSEMAATDKGAGVRSSLESMLSGWLAELMDTTPEKIDTRRGFYELGLDSKDLLQVVRKLESELKLDLYPTLLFEYDNVKSLVQYLAEEWGENPTVRAALTVAANENTSRPGDVPSAKTETASASVGSDEPSLSEMRNYLEGLVAAYLKDGRAVQSDVGFYELGLESSDLLKLVRQLEHDLEQDFYPTMLFEYNTIGSLAEHLHQTAGNRVPRKAARRVERKDERPVEALFFQGVWEDAPLPASLPSAVSGGLLVFERTSLLSDALRARLSRDNSSEVISVLHGETYQELDEHSFQINFGSRQDYLRLLERLKSRTAFPEQIIFRQSASPRRGSANDAEQLEDAFKSLLYLTAALMRRRGGKNIRLVYCAGRSGRAAFEPEAALGSMFKSIRSENPGLRYKLLHPGVDSADGERYAGALLERVLAELREDEHVEVRYQEGRRQVLRFREFQQAPLAGQLIGARGRLRERGVYLISGGLGGVALIFARFLAERAKARLVLCGRSAPDEQKRAHIRELEALGAQVMYSQTDISRPGAAAQLVAEAKQRFGALHGVIHAASVLRDSLIVGKTMEDARAVLTPKVAGCLQLDEATGGEQLDFFVLFSSTAGAWGNPGQADYACANGFLDAFAAERARLVEAGERYGKTVSIGWPLWKNGGMRLDPEREAALLESGLQPLGDEMGVELFLRALEYNGSHFVVVVGEQEKARQTFREHSPVFHQIYPSDGPRGDTVKLAAAPKPDAFAAPEDDLIAIVGVSGRYPMARDLNQFWDNLREGRDCITEVPAERWNHEAIFAPERGKPGKTYSKWGGFLDGVDQFDPLFFHISPREATVIDPQERLFLQTAWHTLEDAGYAPGLLKGRAIGVYVGVMYSQYQLFGVGQEADGATLIPSSFSASIANRVSYFFDFHGPSVALDTMCSSSLTAIHQACDSILKGECEAALAGGVNVSIHPNKYLLLSQASFFSSDGRCRSFGEGGDGYVPGEGVGAVLLKPLSRALADGDHVYAVIRGRSINHGGRTGGFSIPNPEAQAQLILAAYQQAKLDPATISYIEAHGTGTSLGDPIELSGLEKAFKKLGEDGLQEFRCPVGSVKSNIGHLESAAGIAAVTKVVLQMQHRQLVPSLHATTLNSHVDWSRSHFYVQRELSEWKRPRVTENGVEREMPLRAGISSFGAGGSNAHLVVEEYQLPEDEYAHSTEPRLFVFSAKSDNALRVAVRQFLEFLKRPDGAAGESVSKTDAPVQRAAPDNLQKDLSVILGNLLRVKLGDTPSDETLSELGADYAALSQFHQEVEEFLGVELPQLFITGESTLSSLAARLNELNSKTPAPAHGEPASYNAAQIAFTLQVGREAMEERLAVVASRPAELAEKLGLFLEEKSSAPAGVYRGSLRQEKAGRSLPGMDESRAWARARDLTRLAEAWTRGAEVEWELLYHKPYPRRVSLPGYPFEQGRYWITSRPAEAALQTVAAVPLHPLLDSVETESVAGNGIVFRKVFRPEDGLLREHVIDGVSVLAGVVYLEMARAALGQVSDANRIKVERVRWLRPLATKTESLTVWAALEQHENSWTFKVQTRRENELVTHATAILSTVPASRNDYAERLSPEEIRARCDSTFERDELYHGFAQGGLFYGESFRGLRRVHYNANEALGELELPAYLHSELKQMPLHPTLMDGALQTTAAFLARTVDRVMMPYAVESVELFKPPTARAYAYVRPLASGHFNVTLLDTNGEVCVKFHDLALRQPRESAQSSATLREAEFATRLKQTESNQHTSSQKNATGVSSPVEVSGTGTESAVPVRARTGSDDAMPGQTLPTALREAVEAYVKDAFHQLLQIPADKIWPDDTLENYGIDSITVPQIIELFEADLGPLSSTLLFEYNSVNKLTDFFLQEHSAKLSRLLLRESASQQSVTSVESVAPEIPAEPVRKREHARPARGRRSGKIAIVGISGRYPMANTLEEFWDNLKQGKDCISEIPAERWDWQEHSQVRGAPVSRWGGFLDGVDRFDPLLFGMSPRDAEYTDPQERLFLETVWHTLENGGYSRTRLRGARVGVYVGVMYGHYQLFESPDNVAGNAMFASIANRINYTFDFHGPSLALDSMCSSSISAMHLACQSLLSEEVDYAVAGGVNVSIHPRKYLQLSVGRFLSSDGRCRSFGAEGDGYVPSEGVGAVLLKRLEDAERDGDYIHAVIMGSALNHGGKTSGFFVPNPVAQSMAISEALERADVDPATISYVEAHGTGTALGDPIEINGLMRAFGSREAAARPCVIGSAKSNIGHLESAAGIAAVTKVVLQMQHRQLVPSLHAETLNPKIEWKDSPFVVQRSLTEWEQPVVYEQGQALTVPRRAGISSFGAGGANAHLILEEYVAAPLTSGVESGPFLILFSAQTQESLRGYAEDFLAFLAESPLHNLSDIAYTLQVGREHLEERLALVVGSPDELKVRLRSFVEGTLKPTDGYRGQIHESPNFFRNFIQGDAGKAYLEVLKQNRDWNLVAQLWVNGVGLEWNSFYASARPRIVPLPGYHFMRERYWIPGAAQAALRPAPSPDENVASSAAQMGALVEAAQVSVVSGEVALSDNELRAKTAAFLRKLLASSLNIAENRVRPNIAFEDYGIDSVMIMEITDALEKQLGELSKTLFFEYGNLNELTDYFVQHHRESLIALFRNGEEARGAEPAPTAQSGKLQTETRTHEPFMKMEDAPEQPSAEGWAASGLAPAIIPAKTGAEKIAIIGISGRFPGAKNPRELWENLKNGTDSIREIPRERWDWRDYYQPEKNTPTSASSKWGGFIEGADKFDARFFHLSPRAAELMDPQERLFLQTAWHLMEDSGYTRDALKHESVGVFVGLMYAHYQLLQNEEGARGSASYASVSNRVSYFMNFNGPSITLDSMCSSSLSAIHLAMQSIRAGDCDLAIAGGVNLFTHPYKYQSLSSMGFLSSDGRCRSFGEGGDGFVPGEGVAAVLLKPLERAIADRDHIYGVIVASALNHDGKTNGFTVPSPVAQGELIKKALTRSGINPETITYIEPHGTGTSLGDPIEITGLTRAFQDFKLPKHSCAIGSIKSNIGHLESAAGVAAVIKVVLQMQHKQLPPSLHSETLNTRIPWESSPFYVQRELTQWETPVVTLDGMKRSIPRRAGVSSFGAGGANAHAILEEYEPEVGADIVGPQLFVLSARNEERLVEYANQWLDFLDYLNREKSAPPVRLADVAYTLQIGREEMEARLAVVAFDFADLRAKLARYVLKQEAGDGIYTGNTARQNSSPEQETEETTGSAPPENLYRERKLETLAGLWVNGATLSWELLYEKPLLPRRVSVPGYPFKQQRFWLEEARPALSGESAPAQEGLPESVADKRVEPPTTAATVTQPESETGEVTGFFREKLRPIGGESNAPGVLLYEASITGSEFFLRDHIFTGKKLMPGVAYIEMAVASARHATGREITRLSNVVWLRPLFVEGARTVSVRLTLSQEFVEYEAGFTGEGNSFVLCSKGRLWLTSAARSSADDSAAQRVDLEAILQRCGRRLDPSIVYKAFQQVGFNYGSTFRPVQVMYCGRDEALSELKLAAEALESLNEFSLHPSAMDGALQTIAGVNVYKEQENGVGYLPFSIGGLEFLKPLQEHLYAHARVVAGDAGDKAAEQQVDIELLSRSGEVLVRLKSAALKAIGGERAGAAKTAARPAQSGAAVAAEDGESSVLYRPVWIETQAAPALAPAGSSQTVFLFAGNSEAGKSLLAALEKSERTGPVILVTRGEAFRRTGELSYQINPEAESDYHELLKDAAQRGLSPDRVLHLWNMQEAASTGGESPRRTESLEGGLFSILFLFKALTKVMPERRVRCLYGYRGNLGQALPHDECLNGFASSIVPINYKFELVSVRFDADASRPSSLAALLPDEMLAGGNLNGKEVGYENGKRFVRSLQRLPPEELIETPATFDTGGVYLITGGLGGLGLVFAKYLASNYKAKLALCGRSALTAEQETQLEHLRSLGAEVLYIRGDVSRASDVESLVSRAREEFGPLQGVLHSAGAVGVSLMATDRSGFEKPLLAKIQGTINLDRATRDEPLRLFLLFSSVAALMGDFGVGSYGAGNRFMDGYAAYREQLRASGQRQGLSLSIGWPLWKDGGMKLPENEAERYFQRTGMQALTDEQGIALFELALRAGEPYVVAARGNLSKINQSLRAVQQDESLPAVRARATSAGAQLAAGAVAQAETEVGAATRTSTPKAQSQKPEMLRAFYQLTAEVLKCAPSELSPADEMEELGFDSISLMGLGTELSKKFDVDIDPLFFSDVATLGELAEKLLREAARKNGPDRDNGADGPAYAAAGEAARRSESLAGRSDETGLREQVEREVFGLIAEVLKVPLEEIKPGDELEELGFDSISFTALGSELSRKYDLEVSPFFFAEVRQAGQLAAKFWEEFGPDINREETSPPRIEASAEPVAGVMSAKYKYAFEGVKNPRLHLIKSPNETEVEVLTCGEGEPIVLFPLAGCMTGWMHQLREFSQTHQVITLQYPGFGASEPNLEISQLEATAQLEAAADLMMKAVEDLKVRPPVHVVGWSMGGFVAQLFAEKYEEAVRSLTLICSAAEVGITPDPENWQEIFMKDFTSNLPATMKRKPEGSLDFLLGTKDSNILMRYLLLVYMFDFGQRIANINRPILLLAGNDDIVFPLEKIQQSHEQAVDSILFVIENAGHYAPLQQPGIVNQKLREFLEQVEGRTQPGYRHRSRSSQEASW